jgi:3-hydroxyisobutyrate dehydrogenase-like beta-hydroxyacid dehydrogenase
MNIGWIGAGKMGLPICQRLKAAGHNVVVLARSDAAAQNLRQADLQPVNSIAALCKNAEVVFSSIPDDAALLQILDGVASLKEGSTYIDISTVSPTASKQVAMRLGKANISYLRSPVSGSTIMAQGGTLTAVVSGPKAKFDELALLFEVFAKKAFHVGEAEEARYLKLVLNSMVAATSALLGEALAFGERGGLSNATMLDVISQSVVASPLINYKRDMIVKEDYSPAATLSMLAKDLDLFLSVGRENRTPLPVNANIRKIYEAALAKGLGENDFFVLVQEASRAANNG